MPCCCSQNGSKCATSILKANIFHLQFESHFSMFDYCLVNNLQMTLHLPSKLIWQLCQSATNQNGCKEVFSAVTHASWQSVSHQRLPAITCQPVAEYTLFLVTGGYQMVTDWSLELCGGKVSPFKKEKLKIFYFFLVFCTNRMFT